MSIRTIYYIVAVLLTVGSGQALGASNVVKYSDLIVKSPWVDVRAFANLSAAKASAQTAGKTIWVTNAQNVNNLTIPTDRGVKVVGSGSITTAGSRTLTLNGPFEAGDKQVFFGTGSVVFGLGSVPAAKAVWFGSTDAISKAVAAVATYIKKVVVGPGVWLDNIVMPTGSTQWGIEVTGNKTEDKYEALPGSWSTVIRAKGVQASVVTNAGSYYNVWRNLVIDGNNQATNGYINGYQDKLVDATVMQATGDGIVLGDLTNKTLLQNVTSVLNGGAGLSSNGSNSTVFEVINGKFRANTGDGALIKTAINAHFLNALFESNAGTGISIYGQNTALKATKNILLTFPYFENNTGYAINLASLDTTPASSVSIVKPWINTNTNKAIKITYGDDITIEDPKFWGAPLTAGYFNVASTANRIVVTGNEASLSSSNITIDGTGAASIIKMMTKLTSAPGLIYSNSLQAGIIKPFVTGSSSITLTPAQVSGTVINNNGQGAVNTNLTLPQPLEGYEFTAVVGTAQAANYWRITANTAATIYFNGGGTPKDYIQITAPTIGAAIRCTAFVSSFYGWLCTPIAGTWVTN